MPKQGSEGQVLCYDPCSLVSGLMRQPAQRSMLWGMGILAATWVLLELLTFRLSAAAVSRELAILGSVVTPAAGGLTAVIVSWRSAHLDPARLPRRAAHLAALGGALVALGAIGFTWASQEIARESGYGGWLHAGVALAAALLGPMVLAASAAVALRRLAAIPGRALFAMGLGGALGAFFVPVMFATVGGARGQICIGLAAATAAYAFGRAAGKEPAHKPRWSFIATLPLVVASLVSGDYGEPWMKVRTDIGRRSKVDHTVWTEQGVFTSSSVTKSKARLGVDRKRTVPYGEKRKNGRKPRFVVYDLPFILNAAKKDRGSALAIGPGAGRHADAAVAYGHPYVDAIEVDARVVNELLYDRYHTVTGGLYHDENVVRFSVGDGRGSLRRLPRDYEHIMLMSQLAVDQASPRMIPARERLLTVEGVKELLGHLREDGTVFLMTPEVGRPRALRTAMAALPDPAAADDHIFACTRLDHVYILVAKSPLKKHTQQQLNKKCKRAKGTVAYPFEEVRRGRRDHDRLVDERADKLAELEAAMPAYDNRPFLESAPSPSVLGAEAMSALSALRPMPHLPPTPRKGVEPKHTYVAPPSLIGLSAAAAVVAILLLILALAVPGGRQGAPWSLRLSFPCFGAALAISMFALVDALVGMMGTGLAAWSLVIPLGLAGVGSGRLCADTLAADPVRLRKGLQVGLGVGALWLLLMLATVPALASFEEASSITQALITMALAVITGGLLGFPFALGLRLLAAGDRAWVSWAWGTHLAGWGAGGAMALVLVQYLGVRNLWLVGLADFMLGGVLMMVAAVRARASVRDGNRTTLAAAE